MSWDNHAVLTKNSLELKMSPFKVVKGVELNDAIDCMLAFIKTKKKQEKEKNVWFDGQKSKCMNKFVS